MCVFIKTYQKANKWAESNLKLGFSGILRIVFWWGNFKWINSLAMNIAMLIYTIFIYLKCFTKLQYKNQYFKLRH